MMGKLLPIMEKLPPIMGKTSTTKLFHVFLNFVQVTLNLAHQ